ncbi:MAG: hypothetical protein H0W56_03400 [Acidothermales bacterium]|nr:hypothetical protein [Acidothermales bacterium]
MRARLVRRPLTYLTWSTKGAGMAEETLAVLRGGSRDGESTVVSAEVNVLRAASDAPGMLDVYEATPETAAAPDGTPGVVYAFVGQQSATEIAPEALHMPSPPGQG